MVSGDVGETATTTETDEDTCKETKSAKRKIPMLFVWEDGVVVVAQPLRVG